MEEIAIGNLLVESFPFSNVQQEIPVVYVQSKTEQLYSDVIINVIIFFWVYGLYNAPSHFSTVLFVLSAASLPPSTASSTPLLLLLFGPS